MHSPAVSRDESLMGILPPDTTINCLWAEGRWSDSGACDTFARHCLCVFVRPKDTAAHAVLFVVCLFVCLIFHFAFWRFGQESKAPKCISQVCITYLLTPGNVFLVSCCILTSNQLST